MHRAPQLRASTSATEARQFVKATYSTVASESGGCVRQHFRRLPLPRLHRTLRSHDRDAAILDEAAFSSKPNSGGNRTRSFAVPTISATRRSCSHIAARASTAPRRPAHTIAAIAVGD